MSDRGFSSWKKNYKVITALFIYLCTRLLQYWLYTCVQGYYSIGYVPMCVVFIIIIMIHCLCCLVVSVHQMKKADLESSHDKLSNELSEERAANRSLNQQLTEAAGRQNELLRKIESLEDKLRQVR